MRSPNPSSYDIANAVPPVPLSSSEVMKDPYMHWLPSYASDQLYIEMCEKEVEDPHGRYGNRISKYYLEAAKYARRISAGDFQGENAKLKPIFKISSKDLTTRLESELKLLKKTSPDTLKRVVENAIFRIFRARHKMIFFDYIQAEALRWRFVD
jgi:hypothetical protein